MSHIVVGYRGNESATQLVSDEFTAHRVAKILRGMSYILVRVMKDTKRNRSLLAAEMRHFVRQA